MIRETDSSAPLEADSPLLTGVLGVNVGNSGIHLGALPRDTTVESVVLAADALDGLDDAIARIWAFLEENDQRVIVASSVAPKLLERFVGSVDAVLGEEVLVIGRQVDLPIPIALDAPEKVGVDRVCAAAAAHAQLGEACVVADFGTAITIDLVGDDGVFMGGTILPGLRLSCLSLQEHTAALPFVERIVAAAHPWGRDTREAINNGVLFGAVGALREVAERYATELGRWLPLIATGGGAELIAKEANFVDRVVPDLTLRGIALAYHRMTIQSDD
ncbi:MAG: type III pantothenate kinase [Phycisphaerae bacterium]|nr:type III pantothenate kinase [Phycisphaerae bacterium]